MLRFGVRRLGPLCRLLKHTARCGSPGQTRAPTMSRWRSAAPWAPGWSPLRAFAGVPCASARGTAGRGGVLRTSVPYARLDVKEVEDEQDVNRQPRSDRTHPLGSIAQHHEQPRLMEPKPHDPDPEQRHEDLPVAQIADVLLLRDAPPRRALLRAVRPVGVVVASSCRRSAWGDCGRCVRGSWGSPRRVPHRRRPRVRTRSEGTRAAGSPARLLQRGERVLSTARTKGCQTKVEMSGSCTRSRVVAARCDEPPRLEHLHSYSRVPAPLLPSTSRTTPPRGCRWVTSCASSTTRWGRPLRS